MNWMPGQAMGTSPCWFRGTIRQQGPEEATVGHLFHPYSVLVLVLVLVVLHPILINPAHDPKTVRQQQITFPSLALLRTSP